MIRDFASFDGAEAITCDLCIAGAGAAGITIALEFAGRGELDIRSVRALLELTGQELGRMDLGRLQIEGWIAQDDHNGWSDDVRGHYHHMGTTRMASDPSQGVVAPDCQVFGIANLHIAGSSVFVTGGCANPTLSLTALALRLPDRLKLLLA